MRRYILQEMSYDPCHNLAYEESLVLFAEKAQAAILYLWQNDKTIVIGRNQDAAGECDLIEVERRGIRLVRRKSGGGAVYHDLGNLNFSMILPGDMYDVKTSTGVIVDAMLSLGLSASPNDRNDILIDEKKVSGNAYLERAGVGLHHGTIMYDLDVETMKVVLTPSMEKLARNRIASVEARVANIKDFSAGIQLNDIMQAIIDAFCNTYDGEDFDEPEINQVSMKKYERLYRDDDWNFYGKISEVSD